MDTHRILTELRAERDRIDQAIAAIESLSSAGPKTGRRIRSINAGVTRRKDRRRMSAAARQKLSRLLKQRWAQGKMKPKRKAA